MQSEQTRRKIWEYIQKIHKEIKSNFNEKNIIDDPLKKETNLGTDVRLSTAKIIRKQIEEELGIKAVRVLRDVDSSNNAIVIFEGPDQDAMDKLHTDPRVQDRFNDRSIFVEPPKLLGRFTPVLL